jgi:hypothetical protein
MLALVQVLHDFLNLLIPNAMSKTKALIRYAIAFLLLRLSLVRPGRGMVFYLVVGGLLTLSAFCKAGSIQLDSSHFEVTTTSFEQSGQAYFTTRVSLTDTLVTGNTGMHGRLRLKTNIPANFLVTKSWSSTFEVAEVSIVPIVEDPFSAWLEFGATSSAPLDGDSPVWLEITYSGSEGASLFKVEVEILGIVQIDIIEGGCKVFQLGTSQNDDPESFLEGITPRHLADHVRVFPNPAMERVQVEWGSVLQPTSHLRLIDREGRLVMERSASGTVVELNVVHLPAGTYFLLGLSGNTVLWQVPILKR